MTYPQCSEKDQERPKQTEKDQERPNKLNVSETRFKVLLSGTKQAQILI